MRLIDADALKYKNVAEVNGILTHILTAEEIDNAPTVDIKDQIAGAYNEGYMCGNREAEKARPQGEWIVTAEDNDGVHRICCPYCSYEKGSNNTDHIIVTFHNFPKFCENCGADMRKGGAE